MYYLCSHPDPHAQHSALGLMFCHYHLKFLITFEQGPSIFILHWAPKLCSWSCLCISFQKRFYAHTSICLLIFLKHSGSSSPFLLPGPTERLHFSASFAIKLELRDSSGQWKAGRSDIYYFQKDPLKGPAHFSAQPFCCMYGSLCLHGNEGL